MARLISWGQREEDTQRVSWVVSAIWSWTRTSPWRCRHLARLPTRTRASPERHPCRPTLDGQVHVDQRLGYENASRWIKAGQAREKVDVVAQRLRLNVRCCLVIRLERWSRLSKRVYDLYTPIITDSSFLYRLSSTTN